MLREPQHERKIINAIISDPFVLSAVKGLRAVFQQPVEGETQAERISSAFDGLIYRC